jgi:hypothetical protein
MPRAVGTVAGAQVESTSGAVADKTAEDSRPSVLIPILKVLVDASTAFTPLNSAASGLLKVAESFEVRHCSFLVAQYLTYRLPGRDRKQQGTNRMSRR